MPIASGSRTRVQITALDMEKVNKALLELSELITSSQTPSDLNRGPQFGLDIPTRVGNQNITNLAGRGSIVLYGPEGRDLAFAKGCTKANDDDWIATDTAAVIWSLQESDNPFISGGGETALFIDSGLTPGQAFIPTLVYTVGGNSSLSWYSNLRLPNSKYFQISAADLTVGNDSIFQIYHTTGSGTYMSMASESGPSDKEYLNFYKGENGVGQIITAASGTGTVRDLEIGTQGAADLHLRSNSTNRWTVDSSGHLVPVAANSYDIGSTSARVRNIYAGDGGSIAPINELPGCGLYRAAAMVCGHGAWTDILWTHERWDTDGFHSTTTNTERITIPSGLAGKYLVNCRVMMISPVGGRYILRVQKGTVDWGWDEHQVAASTNQTLQWNGVFPENMTVGNYFKCSVYQDSGAARNTNVGVQLLFSATRIGDWG
jgi:hypothetical protein